MVANFIKKMEFLMKVNVEFKLFKNTKNRKVIWKYLKTGKWNYQKEKNNKI